MKDFILETTSFKASEQEVTHVGVDVLIGWTREPVIFVRVPLREGVKEMISFEINDKMTILMMVNWIFKDYSP